MKHIQGRRCLSILLTLVMVLGLLPTGLFTVEAKADTITYDSTAGNFSYGILSIDGRAVQVTSYNGTATAVEVPQTIRVSDLSASQQNTCINNGLTSTDTFTVTYVERYFLYYSENGADIQYVKLPATIGTISEYAFGAQAGESALKEVTLAEGSRLTTVFQRVFSNPSLQRVGIGSTDKMPASLKLLYSYAFKDSGVTSIDFSACTELYYLDSSTFSGSAIGSIVMPPNLRGIGTYAFKGCTNLTSVTLPETCGKDQHTFADGKTQAGYIESSAFWNCTNLTSVTFEGGLPVFRGSASGYDCLAGVSANCTVYIPQPATDADYATALSNLYNQMGAHAGVKLRWIGSTRGQTAPNGSSAAVTLTGADADNGTYALGTYNPNGDPSLGGLGAVLVVKGRQNVTDPLTLTLSGVSGADYAVWSREMAYGASRQGTNESEALFGAALTENMCLNSALGKAPDTLTTTPSISLRLYNSTSLGAYYYIPKLVKTGDRTTPQTSVALAPVLVLYQPDATNPVSISPSVTKPYELNFQITKNSNDTYVLADAGKTALASSNLSGGMNLYSTSFMAMLPEAFTGQTEMPLGTSSQPDEYDYDTGIWYQWQWLNPATGEWEDTYDNYSYRVGTGYATYNGYEKSKPSGIQWKAEEGIPARWFTGKGEGSYTFRLFVSASADGYIFETYSGEITVNLYTGVTMTGWNVENGAGISNFTEPETNSTTTPATMKLGAQNVTLTPKTTLESKNFRNVYAKYTYSIQQYDENWTYKTSTLAVSKTTAGFDPGQYLTEPGNYGVLPLIYICDGDGNEFLTLTYSSSNTSVTPYYITVQNETADYSDLPEIDDPGVVYFDYTGLNTPTARQRGVLLTGTNLDKVARVALYETPDRDTIGGGTLLYSNFTVALNGSNLNVFFPEGFFDSYDARWCYFKLTCTDGSTVFSPVFAALPGNGAVDTTSDKKTPAVSFRSTPEAQVWAAADTETSLTYNVQLINVPLQLSKKNPGTSYNIFKWEYYDGSAWQAMSMSSGGTVNTSTGAAAGWAFDLTSVDISGGDLVLRGTATLKTQYVSSKSKFAGGLAAEEMKVRLSVTDAWQNGTSATAVKTSSTTTLTKAGAVPGVSENLSYANRLWNGTAYETVSSSDGRIPANTYVMFSEAYDGKEEGDTGNQPATPDEGDYYYFTANVKGSPAAPAGYHKEMWWNIYRNGVLVRTLKPDLSDVQNDGWDSKFDVVYQYGSTGADSLFVRYGIGLDENYDPTGYADPAASALYVSIPNTSTTWKFACVPQAVFVSDTDGSVYSSATGTTRTVVINPLTDAQTPYIKGNSGAVNISYQTKDSAPTDESVVYTLSADVYVYGGIGELTYQWYYADTPVSNASQATPIGSLQAITGTPTVRLPLTKAMLNEFAPQYAGVRYYYLYITNTDETALNHTAASRFVSVATVRVGSYESISAPEIVRSDSAETTVYWQNVDKGLDIYSVTTAPLPDDVNRSVAVAYKVTDPSTGEVLKSNNKYYQIHLSRDEDTGSMVPSYAVSSSTFTQNGDGSHTWTIVPGTVGVGNTYTNAAGQTIGTVDIEFWWIVTDTYNGDVEMASGGNTATSETAHCIVHQIAPETSYFTDLTLDSVMGGDAAETSNLVKVAVPETLRSTLGTGAAVDGFKQYKSDARPFTAVLNVPAWGGGLPYGASVQLQYWNAATGAWVTMSGTITSDKAMTHNTGYSYGAYSSNDLYSDGSLLTVEAYDIVNADAGVDTTAGGSSANVLFLRLYAETGVVTDPKTNNVATAPCQAGTSDVFALIRLDAAETNAPAPSLVEWPRMALKDVTDETGDVALDLGIYTRSEDDTVIGDFSYELLYGHEIVASGTFAPDSPLNAELDAFLRPELRAAWEAAENTGKAVSVDYRLRILNTDTTVTGDPVGEWETAFTVTFGTLSAKPQVQLKRSDGGADITHSGSENVITVYKGDTNTVTLTADITNQEAMGDLSYQWYCSKDGVSFTAYSGSGYNTPAIELPTYWNNETDLWFQCRVTNLDSDATVTTGVTGVSPTVHLVITPPPTPTSVMIYAGKKYENKNSFHKGGKLTFANEVVQPLEPDNAPEAELKYQWYISTKPTFDETALGSLSGSAYSIDQNSFTIGGTTYDTLYVFLEVYTTRFGWASQHVRSAGYPVTLLDAEAPTLTEPAEPLYVKVGEEFTLTVESTSNNTHGDQPYGSMRYEWWWSETPDGSRNLVGSGYTDESPATASQSYPGIYYYWCKAYEQGTGVRSGWSNEVCLTVICSEDGAAVPPIMTRTGERVRYFTDDGTATLAATATSPDGGAITYQWQKQNPNSSWVDVAGETADTLTVACPASAGADHYRLVATNTVADKESATNTIDFWVVREGCVLTWSTEPPAAMLTGASLNAGGSITWYGKTANDSLTDLSLGIEAPLSSWITLNGNGSDYETGVWYQRGFTLTGTAAEGSITFKVIAFITQSTGGGGTTQNKVSFPRTITVQDCVIDQTKLYLGEMDANALYDGVQLTASDISGTVSGTVWEVTSGTLPEGVTLNADGTFSLADGKVLGTPAHYPVTVSVTYNEKTYSQAVDLIIQSEQGVENSYTTRYVTIGYEQVNLNSAPTGPGYSYDPDTGVLTLTNFTGNQIYLGSYRYCLVLEGTNTLSAMNVPNLVQTLDDLHVLGSGSLTAKLINSATGSTVLGFDINGTEGLVLREGFTGSIDLTVSNSGSNNVYGVTRVVQRSTGPLTINVRQSEADVQYAMGVHTALTVSGSGKVTVTVDGGGKATYVYGVDGTTATSGTVDVSVTAKNGSWYTYGGFDADLGHTDGPVTFAASSTAGGSSSALRSKPANEANYQVTGAYNSGSVTYVPYTNATPQFLVNGKSVTGSSYAITTGGSINAAITAYCSGGCTVEVVGTLPDGLTYADGVLSGTVTASGSCTLRATSKADPGVSADLTVSWTYSDITIHAGYQDGGRMVYDTTSQDAWVSSTGDALYFFAQGPSAASVATWEVTCADGEMSGTQGSTFTSNRFYDRDNNANYVEAPGRAFNFTPNGLAVDATTTITVTAKDSGGNVLGTQVFTVGISNGNAPRYIQVGSVPYYGARYTDYDFSASGWTWNHKTGTLTLTNYSGSDIYASGGALAVDFSGTNTVSGWINIGGYALTLTGASDDAVLRVNNTYSTALYANSLTVNGQGRVLAASRDSDGLYSGLSGGTPVTVARTVSELRLTGKFYYPVKDPVVLGEEETNYYLCNDTADAAERTGVFLFGTKVPQEAEITVTGPDSVVKGETAEIKVQLPAWMTGATLNGGEEKAFTLSYQWNRVVDISDNEYYSGTTTDTLKVTYPFIDTSDIRCKVTMSFNGVPVKFTSESFTLNVVAAGVKVNGQVKSYNPGNETTVTLYDSADTAHETPLYTTTIAAETGSGQITQSFRFDAVASGTYDLVVTKAGHLTYTIKGVVVGSTDLDLTKNANASVSTITLLAGDVDEDGNINESDVSVIRYASNINKLASSAANPLADVDGDGNVNESDVSIVRYAVHINKNTGHCTYVYAE